MFPDVTGGYQTARFIYSKCTTTKYYILLIASYRSRSNPAPHISGVTTKQIRSVTRQRRGGGMKKSAGLTLARRLLCEKITAANKFFCSVKTFFCTFVRRIAANSSAIGVKIRTDFRRRKNRRLFPSNMTTQTEQIGDAVSVPSGLSSATTLTIENGANYVVMQPSAQAIYVTTNGTTPSATNGMKIPADAIVSLDVFYDQTTKVVSTVVKVIEAAASATLKYHSEKLKQPAGFP